MVKKGKKKKRKKKKVCRVVSTGGLLTCEVGKELSKERSTVCALEKEAARAKADAAVRRITAVE